MKKLNIIILTVLIILACTGSTTFAQPDRIEEENQKLTATILHLDSMFWKTYNECTTEKSGQYLTDDVLFYHDKGGVTNGKTALVASIKNNICGNPDLHIRREAVEGTVNVYPMRNGDSIYGAIISGEHYFYVTEANKPERREGLAKFTHLWLLKNGEWKMSFVLSYSHGPAPYTSAKKEITLPVSGLKKFEGTYKNEKFGEFNFKAEGNHLLMEGKGFHSTLYPESSNMFFVKERDLAFEFVTGKDNRINRIIVHENGAVVDELSRP